MSARDAAVELVPELTALHRQAIGADDVTVQDRTWEVLDNVADFLRHRLFPKLPYRPLHMGMVGNVSRLLAELPTELCDDARLVDDVQRMREARDAAVRILDPQTGDAA